MRGLVRYACRRRLRLRPVSLYAQIRNGAPDSPEFPCCGVSHRVRSFVHMLLLPSIFTVFFFPAEQFFDSFDGNFPIVHVPPYPMDLAAGAAAGSGQPTGQREPAVKRIAEFLLPEDALLDVDVQSKSQLIDEISARPGWARVSPFLTLASRILTAYSSPTCA